MDTDHYSKMVELLSGIMFDKRYYEYYEKHKHIEFVQTQSMTAQDLQSALSTCELSFVFKKKEKFYLHRQAHEHCVIDFGVALLYGSSVEFVLSIKTIDGYIGGPFPMLARDIAELRDPNFEYSPRSPKLPASNYLELQEAVDFGISLFRDAKTALLSFSKWDATPS